MKWKWNLSAKNIIKDQQNGNISPDPSTAPLGNAVQSVLAKYLGTGLTGAEREQNLYTAMREDTQAQRAVADYQAAGLNPALMYENGAGGDYASSSAGGVAGAGGMTDLVSAMTLPLQIEQMKANIDLTKRNANKVDSETDLNKQHSANLAAEYDNIKQELQNKIASEKLTEAERQECLKRIEWADRMNEAIVHEKESSAALSNSQKERIDKLLQSELDINLKTIADFDYAWAKIDAEIDKMAQETGLLKKDIEYYALNHAQNGMFGTGISIPNLIRGARASGVRASGNLSGSSSRTVPPGWNGTR